MSLDIGAIIDRRYLLKREIARGGAGAVFEAEHVYTKRSVALKLLVPEQRSVAEHRARLLREALALSAARHPGVVAALDAGETDDGTPYLVLELLEGRSLEGILAVRRRIAAAEVAWVGAALCDALGAAHRQGIIHRDIKPSNVFVARDEQGREVVKLFDFGVARIPNDEAEQGIAAHHNKLTQVGALLGTPEYMAPEQLLARPVDARTDLYALGVTLYECLAGVVPFEGNFGEVLLKVSTQTLPPLRQKVPDVPADFAAAIERALASEPHFRYADAESFAQALRKAVPVAAAFSLLGIRQGPPPNPVAQTPAAEAPPPISRAGAPRAAPVPPPLPATRRRYPRAPYVTPVRIVHGQTLLDGRSEDVSVGGLLVLAPQAFEQAELVKVRFALPMTGKVIEIGATARWVKAAARATGAVGLQFSALPAEAHEVIERYVTMMGGE
ncbi:MAG TPA: serine/threonine-protein kinase [Polyangiaceae bacterium]|nr:serine/threonine-protein kinase [Polyangiaceae bacterium]